MNDKRLIERSQQRAIHHRSVPQPGFRSAGDPVMKEIQLEGRKIHEAEQGQAKRDTP